MSFFDIFQLSALAFFLIVFLGQTLILWLKQGINPFALGARKKGLPRLRELLLFPWLVLWMLMLIASALHIPFRTVAVLWNSARVTLLAKILGVLVILAGDVVFLWALISLGSSWRVGIDEKSAGPLVTGGIFFFPESNLCIY